MSTIQHASIPDNQLHEPKGIENALDGQIYVADGAGSGSWETLSFIIASSAYPVGTIVDYAGDTAPSGWELCHGQGLQRVTYSDLFSAIGTVYGVGDGSTTFNIPDCRGRVSAGKDNMGGTSANRLTNPVDGSNLNVSGGSETVTLIAAQIPELTGTAETAGAHTHSINNGTGVVRQTSSGEDPIWGNQNPPASGSTSLSTAAGGAHTHDVTVNTNPTPSAHNNVQPTIIMNKIIYHGVF